MGPMAEGWLPPTAPGAKPPPRFEAPQEEYAPPQPAQQPQQTGPTFVRPGQAGPPTTKGNRAALWGIWLGITGVTLLLLSLGTLFPVTLPLSAAAWVLARRAHAQIESGATTQGEGQATAALWLGRIGVIAGVAAFVVFIVLIASGIDLEQLRDDLERELDERREERDGGGADRVRTAVEQLRAAAGAFFAR
jgi:hypothetical protein